MADSNTKTDLLEQLRGIHLPPPPAEPPLWPLAVALLIILSVAAILLLRHRNKPRWHRQALQELKRIEATADKNQLHAVAQLLKRVVLTNNAPAHVRTLSGNDWLMYLDSFFNTRYFTRNDGTVFGTELYRDTNHEQINTKKIINKVKRLIRHRVWFGV